MSFEESLSRSYGFRHTPLYFPDFSDPSDVALSFVSHAAYAYGARAAALAYSGAWPGPGHGGIIYEALFSPAVQRGGSSALSETMYAMRVYSTPFRAVARFLGPVGLAVWFGSELYANRSTQRPGHQQRVTDVQAWQDSIMPPPE